MPEEIGINNSGLSDETRMWLLEIAENARTEIGPPRILKIAGLGEYKDMEWDERLTWNLVRAYDAVKQAIGIIDAREPKWKKFAKTALKIAESILFIAGAYCAKRL